MLSISQFCSEMSVILQTGQPFTWIRTHEEERAIEVIFETISKLEDQIRPENIYNWTIYQKLQKVTYDNDNHCMELKAYDNNVKAPPMLIDKISTMENSVIFLKDFHVFLDNNIIRAFKDLYNTLSTKAVYIIIISPIVAHGPCASQSGLPVTFEKQVKILDLPLLTREEIQENVIKNAIDDLKNYDGFNSVYSKEDQNNFSKSLQGLTATEMLHSIESSIVQQTELDVNRFLAEKKKIISKSDTLEYIDTITDMSQIGGLDNLKEYVGKYTDMHSDTAKEFGVEPIKGIILTGIPGTGKSLSSKAISALWKLPLVRMDIGRLLDGIVGSSEARTRDAIKTVVAIKPAVLWIDEVEKALSGTGGSGKNDSGVMQRVFGTLLTAMEEGMDGITILATANNLSHIPPEFMRRFNEVFFVDLPEEKEREEIFKIHLAKRKRDFDKFSIEEKAELIMLSENYTGAEIEKAIKAAIATAFCDKCKDMTFSHLANAIKNTKPLSITRSAEIEETRKTAKAQYIFANKKKDVKKRSKSKLNLKSLTVKEKGE